jgi:hypothetical protein
LFLVRTFLFLRSVLDRIAFPALYFPFPTWRAISPAPLANLLSDTPIQRHASSLSPAAQPGGGGVI